MDQEFYSIKEVATIFAVHQITIRRAIKKGYLVAIRIGGGKRSPYRVSKKEIEAIHHSMIQSLASKTRGKIE
jgi:excisionase family DNA binding protein